jgi:hypothetical protein
MSGDATSCPDKRKNQLHLNRKRGTYPGPSPRRLCTKIFDIAQGKPSLLVVVPSCPQVASKHSSFIDVPTTRGSAESFVQFAHAIRRPLVSTQGRTKENLPCDLASKQDELGSTSQTG